MGTQNCMMSGCCGGKTHSPGVRDLNSNHTSGLAALCLAALCPCPSPHPGPSSKHLRSPSLPQGAVRQMYRVSQDLGTQHAHSVTPELLVTLPAALHYSGVRGLDPVVRTWGRVAVIAYSERLCRIHDL